MEIESFSSSLEAMGYLAQHHADLLITDFRMPFVDGLRLTRHVRARDKIVPIVIMSDDEIESQALATGATVFLPKRNLPSQISRIPDRCAVNCHIRS